MSRNDLLHEGVDLLFRHADVIDGTGQPRVRGDIAVRGDRIVGIGEYPGLAAGRTIDCSGLVLCPGFIDVHAHDEKLLLSEPEALPKASQGVTTVVTGNCGVSLAPLLSPDELPAPLTEIGGAEDYRFATFGSFLQAVSIARPAINGAFLVGHTTLRVAAMNNLDRPADAVERAHMRQLVEEAMASGAFGISSGLFYPPAQAAPMEEVADLAAVAGAHGGIYTAHLRSEGDAIIAAIDEAVEIARRAGCPLIISHHKLMGQRNFGRSPETLRRISHAATLHPVGFDMYPYTAGSSMLSPAIVAMASRTVITWSDGDPSAAGIDLEHYTRDHGVTVDEAIERLLPAGAVYFMMDEEDVRRILAHPEAMIGSDGVPMQDHPHPRLWNTFPRVLGHYSRMLGLLTLEDAIRRMTGLPAARLGLADRGVIAPGAIADLVLLDAATVDGCATYTDPVRPARGIASVYVAGVAIQEDGRSMGARPGRVVRPRRHGSPQEA